MDELREDVLREIASIGSGHAASALAALLDRPIVQSIPKVELVPLADVPDILGGAEKIVVAGMLHIAGDLSGYLLIVLDFEQAEKMISMVRGSPERRTEKIGLYRFSALDQSVLSETVNIMGSSYLTAVADLTNLNVTPSIPYLCIDMAGAVVGIAIAETGKTGDFALLFLSEFFNEKERIVGNLFLIPDERSCSTILRSLGFL